jgi:hypothetical protein
VVDKKSHGFQTVTIQLPTDVSDCRGDNLRRPRQPNVVYVCKGPTSKWHQPPLKPDEKELLQNKIIKFFEKKYITPPRGWISSLIKYFAIPKRLQDWRIDFHPGANQLNDCVWAPLFCLPTINLLLCIVDIETMMEDQDIGKMFLNFQLHPNTTRFAAVDLGPLRLTYSKCLHQ